MDPGTNPRIWSGIWQGILSRILSGILSGILPGVFCRICLQIFISGISYKSCLQSCLVTQPGDGRGGPCRIRIVERFIICRGRTAGVPKLPATLESTTRPLRSCDSQRSRHHFELQGASLIPFSSGNGTHRYCSQSEPTVCNASLSQRL